MARRNRSRRRVARGGNERSTLFAAIAVSAICLFAVAGFGYWKMTVVSPPDLVAKTLCPENGPDSLTVVLIDASDDIPEIGRLELERYLEDVAGAIPEYGLLELRLLDPDQLGGQILFSRCNPGDGANLSALTANPEMARRRWDDEFRAPLANALRTSLAPSGASTSPILGTLQAIAVQRFSGQRAMPLPKSLIVVSDMLEHGPGYSHYQGDPGFDRFKATRAYRQYRTSLHGAEVTVRYIDRPSTGVDPRGHIAFWDDWVGDNGGDLVEVERVQGAG